MKDNKIKESLNQALKIIESFLNACSKRELILLFIFCFLAGFLAVFSVSFERTKESLEARKQKKADLQKEFLGLQRLYESSQIPNDTKKLENLIQDLEQKIATQERQKILLQSQSSIYALRQIANSKNLQDFVIEQENQRIQLYGQGKYYDFVVFLENLESQVYVESYNLNLYPNILTRNLEFYLEIVKKQEKKNQDLQEDFK